MNRTDWTYEKGGHRKAEIRFGFPEWLTAEITGSHIQELTRFQREIFAELRRSSQTSRVNPGSSAPRKCMKSSRSSCISRFIIRTAILSGIILATSELSLIVCSIDRFLSKFYKFLKNFRRWNDIYEITINFRNADAAIISDCLARIHRREMRNKKSVERPNDLHLIILQRIN